MRYETIRRPKQNYEPRPEAPRERFGATSASLSTRHVRLAINLVRLELCLNLLKVIARK